MILTLDELTALGVSIVSLGESIDTTTAAGRPQLHILGAFAEFERGTDHRARARLICVGGLLPGE